VEHPISIPKENEGGGPMIRDRGRIKWTSMMLPEHVKMLRNWAKEDSYEQPITVDEQALEKMNEITEEALHSGKRVVITHYDDHQYRPLIGTIVRVDTLKQTLHVEDNFSERWVVPLANIVDIRFHEEELSE
jgi:hypothetical protein